MARSREDFAQRVYSVIQNYQVASSRDQLLRDNKDEALPLLKKYTPRSQDVEEVGEIDRTSYIELSDPLHQCLRTAGITDAELERHGFLCKKPELSDLPLLNETAIDTAVYQYNQPSQKGMRR